MPTIEQHGREKHDMTIDDHTRDNVRNAITNKLHDRLTDVLQGGFHRLQEGQAVQFDVMKGPKGWQNV